MEQLITLDFIKLGVGAVIGVIGMWFMYNLCREQLRTITNALNKLVGKIEEEQSHSREQHRQIMEELRQRK